MKRLLCALAFASIVAVPMACLGAAGDAAGVMGRSEGYDGPPPSIVIVPDPPPSRDRDAHPNDENAPRPPAEGGDGRRPTPNDVR